MPIEPSRWKRVLQMWLVLVLHLHIATAQTENQNTRDGTMPRESTNSTAFLLELVELGEVRHHHHLLSATLGLVRAPSLPKCVQAQYMTLRGVGSLGVQRVETCLKCASFTYTCAAGAMFAGTGQRGSVRKLWAEEGCRFLS